MHGPASLKRKRTYLSSPPPDPHELDEVHIEAEEQEPPTQKRQGPSQHLQAYSDWSGRGRSPFKTPATAAIDGLKTSARWVEALEREISLQQSQLDALVAEKKTRLIDIHHIQSEMAAGRPAPVLAQPGTSTTRSLSPSKYLAKLAAGNPPIVYHTFEEYLDPLPQSVRETKQELQNGLELGCMPEMFKVSN